MTVVKMTANVQCTYVNVLYIHTVQQNVFFFPLMILLSLTFLSSTQNFKWCKCQNSFQSAYFFIIKSDNFANSLSEHCEFHTYKWTIQYTVSEERENEREREGTENMREKTHEWMRYLMVSQNQLQRKSSLGAVCSPTDWICYQWQIEVPPALHTLL